MCGMCVALLSIFVSDQKAVILSILGYLFKRNHPGSLYLWINLKRRVCIISEKEEEIKKFILENLHSGATIYYAYGAYQNQDGRRSLRS